MNCSDKLTIWHILKRRRTIARLNLCHSLKREVQVHLRCREQESLNSVSLAVTDLTLTKISLSVMAGKWSFGHHSMKTVRATLRRLHSPDIIDLDAFHPDDEN